MEPAVEKDTSDRKIYQGFGFLIGGRILGDFFTFLLFVVLSRAFGQEGIGLYSFAMGLTGFFAVVADFGLSPFSIKELSRRGASPADYYGRIFSLRLVLSALVLGALLLILPFLPLAPESKLIMAVIGVYQVTQRLGVGSGVVFISQDDTHLAGILDGSFKALAALTAIAIVIAGGSLVFALFGILAIAAVQMVVAYGLVARKYGQPRLTASWSSLTQVVRDARPYALSLFLLHLNTRVDVVLLGFFLGAVAAGVYNVAYRIIFLLAFVPQYAANAVFPQASRLYVENRQEFDALYHRYLGLVILIGLPVGAGVWLTAPDVIRIIFGESFAESATVLRILAGVLFLTFVARILGVFLMSSNRQEERMKSLWPVALINVVGNLVLIPAFGVKGAAVAALASEAVLVVLFAVRLRKVLGWPRISSRLAISGVGVTSFFVLFTFLPPLSLFLVIPASALLYSATLVLFKETRTNEVRTLISLVKPRT